MLPYSELHLAFEQSFVELKLCACWTRPTLKIYLLELLNQLLAAI